MAAACADAMGKPGVTGVLCVDSQGLCLHSQGAVPDASSGSVAQLAQHATLLGGDATSVVCVESAQRKVLISKSDGVTTAIFMQPTEKSK